MWEDVFVWKRGKARVLQVKTGWKWIQDLRRQLFQQLSSCSPLCCLYVYLYSTSVFYFWTEPSDCKPFLVSLCSVLFLCSSDTFLWMAVHHWCCWILWSQKHVCSLRPLLVRKPSVLCAFFLLWTHLKTPRKRNSGDYLPVHQEYIHAFAEVTGCLVWNLAAAVNLLRLPDIPSFTWWLRWSTKRKWRLRSALALLLTHQETNTKLGKLFRVRAVVCLIWLSVGVWKLKETWQVV